MDNTTNMSEGQEGQEGPEVDTKVCISCFPLNNVWKYSDTMPPMDVKEEQKEEEAGIFHLQA